MTGSKTTAQSPLKILVRAPNWLGDLVMSTPGFNALRLAHPDAHIVGLVTEPLAALLAGSKDFDEIWTIGSRGLASIRGAARRIATESFDLGIVIPESISSALMMRWGRVSRVVGYARDPVRRLLLHEIVPAPAEWGRRRLVSKERFVLGLMRSVCAEGKDTRLRLETTLDETDRLGAFLASHELDLERIESKPPVVLAPGASYGDSKCWPVAHYAGFADEMARRGECVVLIGTEAESSRTRRVREAMRSSPVDLTGGLDLGMLKALLSRAKLLVANDAGARHMATAFGVPSVVFFGPTSVAKTDENLESVEVLETEHSCRPCYRRSCPIDHRCLTSIDIPEAIAAADRALKATPTNELAIASRPLEGGGRA
jgi:heptosyltransferase-2